VEREQTLTAPKLIDVARQDYPDASEILVSFSDRWEYLDTIRNTEQTLYVAGFPIERAHTARDHFAGLPPDINVSLVFYRLYKFFQPWHMPTVLVDWNTQSNTGQVVGVNEPKLQLQPVGQAQAWFGVDHALIWECYFEESQRRADWQEALVKGWHIIERDVGSEKLWSAPHEPTYPEGYRDFLRGLGYQPDTDAPIWWSKMKKG
jgi:hypothetical protein